MQSKHIPGINQVSATCIMSSLFTRRGIEPKISFCLFSYFCVLDVAVWLIGGWPLLRRVVRSAGVERRLRRRVAVADGLVGIRRLLGSDATTVAAVTVVVGRAAGAAAGADGPEQSGSKRESSGKPGGGVDVATHVSVDSVRLDLVVEDSSDNGEHGGRSSRGGGGEEERCDGDEGRHTGSPAAEDGRDTEEDLKACSGEGDDVGNAHPFGDVLVHVQRILEVVGNGVLQAQGLEIPDFDGVEPELGFWGRAVGDAVVVVVGDVALAVAEKTDIVEIRNVKVLLDFF